MFLLYNYKVIYCILVISLLSKYDVFMRFITLFICLFIISNSLFSQDKPTSDNLMRVIMLIDDDLNGNANEIRNMSNQLELSEKFFIYQEKQKSSTMPFVLNLLLGLGIGSWVQGDAVGGVIGTVGGIGGLVLMNSPDSQQVGAVLFLGTWIFDLFRPFSVSSSYNKKLKSVIGLTDKASLRIYPNINVTQDGRTIPAISLSIAY